MKSAYELAMERLEQKSPTAKLSAAAKAEIAELDSICKAKKAEREVFLKDLITKEQAKGDEHAVAELEQQLARELRRLEEECEVKKEKVRGRH